MPVKLVGHEPRAGRSQWPHVSYVWASSNSVASRMRRATTSKVEHLQRYRHANRERGRTAWAPPLRCQAWQTSRNAKEFCGRRQARQRMASLQRCSPDCAARIPKGFRDGQSRRYSWCSTRGRTMTTWNGGDRSAWSRPWCRCSRCHHGSWASETGPRLWMRWAA